MRSKFKPLLDAVEVVLLDHIEQLAGIDPDPNILELAYMYRSYVGTFEPDPDLAEALRALP
jgi:hypothetical protein